MWRDIITYFQYNSDENITANNRIYIEKAWMTKLVRTDSYFCITFAIIKARNTSLPAFIMWFFTEAT